MNTRSLLHLRTCVPKSILVICTQRIGDVLLATPLAHSLKSAWPEANLDFLVLPGTQGILEGNQDIRHVITFPQRAKLGQKLRQIMQVWRRYDLAVAAIATDRARIFAWAAGRYAIGFTTDEETSWLKKYLLSEVITFDNLNTHTVNMGLRLTKLLGIPAISDVQSPHAGWWLVRQQQLGLDTSSPYAVIHPNPKFRYKMWDSNKWVKLASWLRQQNFNVFLTGSNDPIESRYVKDIAAQVPEGCMCIAGDLSLSETAELLRGAHIYFGPDTVVTHLAAAVGIPTIALFGPSNPVKWGPWPKGWPAFDNPWHLIGTQRCGNVYLIQGPGDCVPCLLEGCDRRIDSDSRCLLDIPVNTVIEAAQTLLAEQQSTLA